MIVVHNHGAEAAEADTEVRDTDTLLQTGASQNAIFNSANFSSIATDAWSVIQIFIVGAVITAQRRSRLVFESLPARGRRTR